MSVQGAYKCQVTPKSKQSARQSDRKTTSNLRFSEIMRFQHKMEKILVVVLILSDIFIPFFFVLFLLKYDIRRIQSTLADERQGSNVRLTLLYLNISLICHNCTDFTCF